MHVELARRGQHVFVDWLRLAMSGAVIASSSAARRAGAPAAAGTAGPLRPCGVASRRARPRRHATRWQLITDVCSAIAAVQSSGVSKWCSSRGKKRPGALVPERPHGKRQRAVAARLGDLQVEATVVIERHHRAAPIALHRGERGLHLSDLCRTRRCCAASAAHSDSSSRRAAISSNGPESGGSAASARAACLPLHHVDTGADADLDIALDLERDQCFAHRRPAHFQHASRDRAPAAAAGPAGTRRGWISCAICSAMRRYSRCDSTALIGIVVIYSGQVAVAGRLDSASRRRLHCLALVKWSDQSRPSFTRTPMQCQAAEPAAEERWRGACRASRRW